MTTSSHRAASRLFWGCSDQQTACPAAEPAQAQQDQEGQRCHPSRRQHGGCAHARAVMHWWLSSTCPLKKKHKNLFLTVFYALLGSQHPCGHGSCCSAHNQVTTVQEASVAPSKCRVTPPSSVLSLLQAAFLLSYLSLPKWSANMTQLIPGNLIVQVRPFKKHLRQHRGFYSVKCQVTGDTFPCIPIKGFAAHTYLSHCCIMDISFMISCRSDSTGTCLIATT